MGKLLLHHGAGPNDRGAHRQRASTAFATRESLPEPLASVFGTMSDPSEMARRALQKNTAIYTLTLFIIVVILFFRG